jgi:uncharacterized Zn ribbon protein
MIEVLNTFNQVFDNLCLIKKYSEAINTAENREIKKIIVDLNHSILQDTDTTRLFQDESLKVVFVSLSDDNKILFQNLFENSENKRFKLLEVDENYEKNLSEILNLFEIERREGTIFKKKSRIFLERDSFEGAMAHEIRRAKRYHYPMALVLFRSEEVSNLELFLNYFSEKIREFDFLWRYENGFAMVLPHTGWDGAEILTSRLSSRALSHFQLHAEALQHNILSLKQTENDQEFLDRVYVALNSKFYNISSGIGFESWKEELYSEFVETNTNIRLMNTYHGMLISHDADISVKNDELFLSNIRPLQLASMHIERATYFQSKTLNRMVRAGIHRINQDTKCAILSNFEIMEENILQRNSLRIELAEPIDVSIQTHDKTSLHGELTQLSLNSALISIPKQFYLQKGNDIDLDFSLKIKSKSHRVLVSTTVTSIEYLNQNFLLELNIKAELNENKIISDFLSKKQLNLINELKNYNFN